MSEGYAFLKKLSEIIETRKAEGGSRSYTKALLEKGMKAIGSKVMEEASEFVTAAHDLEPPNDRENPKYREALVTEAADLLYHSMVMLAHYDLSLADVDAAIARRLE